MRRLLLAYILFFTGVGLVFITLDTLTNSAHPKSVELVAIIALAYLYTYNEGKKK